MSVIMSNKSIPNNGVKEAGTSYEGPSHGTLGVQGQVSGGRSQTTTNKTPLNADNEDNVMVLGEKEWEDLLRNSMEITGFNGFSRESSNKDGIDINYKNKERQTWIKTLNTAVMECYFLSSIVDKERKPVRGYRRRLYNIWKERYGTEITARMIKQG